MMPTLRVASADDAAELAALAERTFRDTFGADSRPEDLALFLAKAYGVEQQARELADARIITLVAEHNGALVAFAQIRRDETPPCVTGPAPIELWRFYVAHEWHGRGLAQALMARVIDAAVHSGAKTVWLGVWERNARARAFYEKAGYVDVGSQVFIVGTDPQTDRVLTRTIGS